MPGVVPQGTKPALSAGRGCDMIQSTGLLTKWCRFWRGLSNDERLVIMRLLGYMGKYPMTGVSAVLMADLLVQTLLTKNNVSQKERTKVL